MSVRSYNISRRLTFGWNINPLGQSPRNHGRERSKLGFQQFFNYSVVHPTFFGEDMCFTDNFSHTRNEKVPIELRLVVHWNEGKIAEAFSPNYFQQRRFFRAFINFKHITRYHALDVRGYVPDRVRLAGSNY